MDNKKRIIKDVVMIALGVIMLIAFVFLGNKENYEPTEKTDAELFAEEYTKVGDDNVFVYRTASEIIDILSNDSGIVYLGFPECKWCQQYVVYLNDVAKKVGVEKIYYFNIKKDRADDTADYQKIVALLKSNLNSDSEGKKRVFVPDITFVKKGKIIGHDNESSMESSGEPVDYWTEEKLSALKTKLESNMVEVVSESCETCN